METPHIFGGFDHLMGVVNRPEIHGDVGVILLTAGMLHHVGPFRLYVRVARTLERQNIPSLRFDLSGIGESLPVATAGTSLQRAASETRQAMDFLEENYGLKRFVLFGLCSGADDAFHTALTEERVAGIVLLDGCGYPAGKFKHNRLLNHYLPRATNLKFWKTKLAGEPTTPTSLQVGDDIREFPSRDIAAEQLQMLVDRGVRLNFIYTGGVAHYYNHADQFSAMFHDVDFRGRVTSKFFPRMDHVALLCEDRERLVATICDWVSENFVSPDTGSMTAPITNPIGTSAVIHAG